jgi:hypothetical protein
MWLSRILAQTATVVLHSTLTGFSNPIFTGTEIIGIRKEDTEKDIWPNTEAERGVET